VTFWSLDFQVADSLRAVQLQSPIDSKKIDENIFSPACTGVVMQDGGKGQSLNFDPFP
jgi:hypothetical protein